MILPTLPKFAIAALREQEAKRLPSFYRTVEKSHESDCQNCGGLGVVYVSFAKAGPYRSLLGGVFTWFDGDGVSGKGFYLIDRTEAYQCPECKGVKG